MKCTKCNEQAFLRVDDNTVLCADCAVTERLKADFNSNASGVSLEVSPDVATGSPVSQPRLSSLSVAPFPDMPDCLIRKNATRFRVAAASSIQVSDV